VSTRGTLNEEYERELEEEIEKENQIVLPPSANPRVEIEWDMSKVLNDLNFIQNCTKNVNGYPCLYNIQEIFKMTKIFNSWKKCRMARFGNVYISENFLMTVDRVEMWDDFLRPIEFVLIFPGNPKKYLLISGMEANNILLLLRGQVSVPSGVTFHHLMHMDTALSVPPTQKSDMTHIEVKVLLMAINGVTEFPSPLYVSHLITFLGILPSDFAHVQIDFSVFGFSGNIENWTDTWYWFLEKGLIDNNGFIKIENYKKFNGIIDDSMELSEKPKMCVDLFRSLVEFSCFRENPISIMKDLICMRGSLKIYKSSTLYFLVGNI